MNSRGYSLSKAFLIIFIPAALAIAALLMFVFFTETASEREIIKRTESSNVRMLKEIVKADLHSAVSDLMILANHSGLKAFLDGDTQRITEVAADLTSFSRRKGSFDHIRYLDETGMEVLRVNYNNGSPILVPKDKLQNKGERYYFLDSFGLSPGEVFVSPFDLNIERGQIEQPLKPMIRLGTPVTDSTGVKRGIVLLNYQGQKLINSITQAHQGLGNILLLNGNGYFLSGLDPADEWGFMYEDRRNIRFDTLYPAAAENWQANDFTTWSDQNGMFTFNRIHPVSEADRTSSGASNAYEPSQSSVDAKDYVWTLVGFVPDDILSAGVNRLAVKLAQVYSLLMLITATGVWFLAKARKASIDDRTTLEQTASELSRSNKELEEFAYIASHDLQEPLRKVLVFGERLETKYQNELGDRGRDYIRRMRSAATRMQTLINDLLDYSRVNTKAQPFTPTDLTKVVNEVLEDLETRTSEVKAKVEISDLPIIDADPLQMRQLFQNLIGNALKFHKPEEPPVVKVSSSKAEPKSPSERIDDILNEIIIEDNGIGFDRAYSERIFGTFQRLHGRKDYEGAGIGLSVCRKIVSRHGGTITAESEPEKGAKFTIRLLTRQSEEINRAA
ncbi:MAG: hypothetical protein GY703_21045 [Gammaproteobacteria bacterium]|nr:hypothetical protein [Gammaproteobacteria bacterium]